MTSWAAIVLALREPDGGSMVSRVPSYLHPVAGRPLIWHTLSALAATDPRPDEIVVLSGGNLAPELFEDLPVGVRLGSLDSVDDISFSPSDRRLLLVHASASLEPDTVRDVLRSGDGGWLGEPAGPAAALTLAATELPGVLERSDPFEPSPLLAPEARLDVARPGFVVRTRADLARAHRRIRDQLVLGLMDSGATFLVPESVVVDVDVRVGRDTVIYPGVVLEGQTTIGEETVIGPGCRIIDSWIGSGVELKGWNYIANTSVRNRAILEPYVRRGFD